MVGKFILVILLISSIFVFGCCSLTPGDNGQTTGPTGSGLPTDAGSQAGNGLPNNGGSTSGNSNDLAGKTFEALTAMGVPLECDVSSTSQGQTVNVKIYMKGNQEMRTEIPAASGDCTKMVGIMKGQTYYVGCADGTMFPGCQWLMIEQSNGNQGVAGSFQTPDYSDVPTSKIDCRPWLYDPSKFATPGKVCSMDDLMKSYET
ncbi:Uncharacterised protein [Candidatus Bilamarchaeum dharawalense]|uniref:Lipoprotein n=1 Tax=Candidatus Bilamarchaeum dharawalense TaxID=2885759 RepID=A0A5E4LT84_9ARCH|nr:Uncharacterised protein [Candidatus Bilamarchaeum dharawalense]